MPTFQTPAVDAADVPRVDPALLAAPFAILVRQGRGLMLVEGRDDTVLLSVESAFWTSYDGDQAAAIAAMIRFRAVVDAFASRRLKSLFLNEGLGVLRGIFERAAEQRLNAERGLSPQGLLWAAVRRTEERTRAEGVAHRGQTGGRAQPWAAA